MRLLTSIRSKVSWLLDEFNYKFNLPDIKVINTESTLDLILNSNVNVVRFGDGEFDLINGKSIDYQDSNKSISVSLKKILFDKNDSKLLICVPDFFSDISRYTEQSQRFWLHDIRKRKEWYNSLSKTGKTFGSAEISRPYINLKNKRNSQILFKKLREIWENKDVLIVEGATSRSGVGNDLFSNAKSVKRIICPSKNAFRSISKIENSILSFKQNRLILVMLGPTAKIIINDLNSQIDNRMIDMGHIDSEYEWFKRGDLTREKIPNKHTAEYNTDQGIVLDYNEEYANEIVDKLC